MLLLLLLLLLANVDAALGVHRECPPSDSPRCLRASVDAPVDTSWRRRRAAAARACSPTGHAGSQSSGAPGAAWGPARTVAEARQLRQQPVQAKGGGSPNDGASIGCSGEQSPATPAWSRERFAWSAAGRGASQALACSDQGDRSWMRGALGLQPAARLA